MNINSNTKSTKILALALSSILIQSCGGGGGSGDSDDPDPTNSGKSYLTVSATEMYFGTQDVGSNSTQAITITNQSADIYPINSIELSGENLKEFQTDYEGGTTSLDPGEVLKIDLTFGPTTTGRKYSSMNVGHGIIVKASDHQNQLEQKYYQAKEYESEGQYEESLTEYQEYIASDPITKNKVRANVKVPVLTESAKLGTDEDFRLYTAALNNRDTDDTEIALANLDKLIEENPDSYLVDDAMYMRGYIKLMDTFEYAEAVEHMEDLRTKHPDSSYYDTALYVEAIAQKELGNTEQARAKFEQLRDRHTGMSVEMFDLQWPKDNYVSRLWFVRTEKGLDGLNENS